MPYKGMEFLTLKGNVQTLFLNLRLILGLFYQLSRDRLVALVFLLNNLIL
jgi:hypothetical protein